MTNDGGTDPDGFGYLINMKFSDLTEERLKGLEKTVSREERELRQYEGASAVDLYCVWGQTCGLLERNRWAKELEALAEAIEPYCNQRDR